LRESQATGQKREEQQSFLHIFCTNGESAADVINSEPANC
jgi:hypothetical protein